MKTKSSRFHRGMMVTILVSESLIAPQMVQAHCDTLDGPVVTDARAALLQQDVTPVLKWISADAEGEIRAVFDRVLAVRKLGDEARALADHSFFETLVRVNRAGEGAPYSGLKAAGSVEPTITKADRALEQGSVDQLARTIASHVEQGIRKRFATALENRKHAADSITQGRKYVESYVAYVHFVEGIVQAVHAGPHHGEEAIEAGAAHAH